MKKMFAYVNKNTDLQQYIFYQFWKVSMNIISLGFFQYKIKFMYYN